MWCRLADGAELVAIALVDLPLAVLPAFAMQTKRSQRLSSCPCVMLGKMLHLRREVEYPCSRNTI